MHTSRGGGGLVARKGSRTISKANVSLTTSTTETSIFPSSANSIGSALRAKVPANYFQVGDRILISARGIVNGDSPSGTFTCKVKHDATAFATGVSTATAISGFAGGALFIDIELEVRSIGAGGTVNVVGAVRMIDPILGETATSVVPIIAAAAALDTTAEWVLDVTLTWGTSSASNNWTIYFSEVLFIDVK